MKRFISRLLKFLIFISVGYACVLLIVILVNRHALDDCTLEDDDSTIIVGDSHAMWSIDDTHLDHVRNLSLNAEGYIYTYAKLQRVLKEDKNIKKVYIAFSYHNFSGYYDAYIYGNLAMHFFDRYIGVLDFSQYTTIFFNNPFNFPTLSSSILKNGTRQLLNKECPLYGGFPSEKMVETFDVHSMEKRIKAQYYLNNKIRPVSKINIEYLLKIIALCRAEKLDLIMLSTPIHKAYKKLIPEMYKELYHSFLHQNNLKLLDMSDLLIADKYFLPDGDHVNYEGAMLTTRNFKEYYEGQTNISKK